MPNLSQDLVTTIAAVSAGLGGLSVVTLIALQTDTLSRRILSSDQLQRKRLSEYKYRWKQALDRAELKIKYFVSGGVSKFIPEKEDIELLCTDDEVADFVNKILNKSIKPRVSFIGKDYRTGTNEFYVWLASDQNVQFQYQVSLAQLGTVLADAFEKKVSTSTFCFVSEASARLASDFIADLVESTKSEVSIVREPLWMACLADVVNRRVYSADKMERALFALCRLEALRCNKSTVMITLPGQSVTTILLPLLQTVFPDDRHVFAYTGGLMNVQTALVSRKNVPRAKVPETLDEALRFNDPVSYTTPLSQGLRQSSNVMAPFSRALSDLPISFADSIESWMGAIDAFFALKEEEKKNGFLPYVFKLDLVTRAGPLEKGSDRYWSLRSLLQYITGSRSRELPQETLDAAISWLKDFRNPRPLYLRDAEKKAIENAVFQHKLILIENKTLKDTVLSAEHWTLKAAAKKGCACCLPDEDEDANDMGALASKLEAFGMNKRAKPVNTYVDGKTTFAFDPSKFS